MHSRTASSRTAALWQVPVILLIATVMAVAVNRLRPDDRLPLMAGHPPTASVQVRDEGDRISLQQARELFGQDGALFLDARSRDDYLRGHIRGALSLPWQEADDHFAEVADRLNGDKIIITYCDGEHCLLSDHLARYLKDMGFTRVRVLENGWSRWRRRGFPIESADATTKN